MPDGPESDEAIVHPWADNSLSPSHVPVAGRGLLDRPSILRKSTIKAIAVGCESEGLFEADPFVSGNVHFQWTAIEYGVVGELAKANKACWTCTL